MCLFLSSLIAGHRSFRDAQKEITEELNLALYQTFIEHTSPLICPDTIQAYKQLKASADGQVLLKVTNPLLHLLFC